MPLQDLKYTQGILQGRVLSNGIPVFLISPTGSVVAELTVFFGQSGENTIVEVVIRADQVGRVGVIEYVFVEIKIVLDGVIHHAVKKGDIGTRPDGSIYMCLGGCFCVPGVYHDDFGAPCSHGNTRKTHHLGMVFSGVSPDHQKHIGIFVVGEKISHNTPTKCLAKTGHSGGVSETGVVVHIDDTN